MNSDRNRRGIDPAAKLSELREGGKKSADAVVLEAEEIEEGSQESFSTRSADRNQKIMLEFRFKTGNAKALAYSYLVSADFNASEGIDLDFSAYNRAPFGTKPPSGLRGNRCPEGRIRSGGGRTPGRGDSRGDRHGHHRDYRRCPRVK